MSAVGRHKHQSGQRLTGHVALIGASGSLGVELSGISTVALPAAERREQKDQRYISLTGACISTPDRRPGMTHYSIPARFLPFFWHASTHFCHVMPALS